MATWQRRDFAMGIIAASSLAAYIYSQGKPTVNQGSTEPRLLFNTAHLTTAATPTDDSPLSAETDRTPPPLPTYRGPEHDAERAALLRDALITRKLHPLHAADDEGASNDEGAADKEGAAHNRGVAESPPLTNVAASEQDPALEGYVQHLMRAHVVPLLERCYVILTEQHPSALGSVGLNFSLLGERGFGGVVVDMDVTATQTLGAPSFRTCLTDAMYALIVEAPPGEAGSVNVEQTFELSP